MELDLTQLVVGVLGLLGIGGGAWEGGRRVLRRGRHRNEPGEPAPGAGESVVSKAEARALADAAAARAAKDAEVVATLQALRSSIDAHEHRDAERFSAAEKRAAEQHGGIMAELARMAAEHERIRGRVHSLADDVAAHNIEIPHLRERIDDTRRQANIDSGVHAVPTGPPRPPARPLRRRGE